MINCTEEVKGIMDNIDSLVDSMNLEVSDSSHILIALCLKNIEMACNMGMSKPKFLGFISNCWESVDSLYDDPEKTVNITY